MSLKKTINRRQGVIAIVNKGPFDDPNPGGERNYEVRINNEVICHFKHKRSDGLEKCLLKAAEAVKMERMTRDIKIFMGMEKDSKC